MRLNTKPKVKYASSEASCCCCCWPHLIVQALTMMTTKRSFRCQLQSIHSLLFPDSPLFIPPGSYQWHLPVSNIIMIGNGIGIEHSFVLSMSVCVCSGSVCLLPACLPLVASLQVPSHDARRRRRPSPFIGIGVTLSLWLSLALSVPVAGWLAS